MSYRVEIRDTALLDLRYLRAFEQRIIMEAIEGQLLWEPEAETRNRKSLRPNDLAAWEMRVGNLRVFYDVSPEAECIIVKAVGWKEHGRLFIRGKEFAV
jgi:mRNA-degrading endonuclease RelE of RelBE toxin-antitoxin system